MPVLLNYNCPNGASPEDCMHIPALVNRAAGVFTRLFTLAEQKEQEQAKVRERTSQSQRRFSATAKEGTERRRVRSGGR